MSYHVFFKNLFEINRALVRTVLSECIIAIWSLYKLSMSGIICFYLWLMMMYSLDLHLHYSYLVSYHCVALHMLIFAYAVLTCIHQCTFQLQLYLHVCVCVFVHVMLLFMCQVHVIGFGHRFLCTLSDSDEAVTLQSRSSVCIRITCGNRLLFSVMHVAVTISCYKWNLSDDDLEPDVL